MIMKKTIIAVSHIYTQWETTYEKKNKNGVYTLDWIIRGPVVCHQI